MTLALVVRRTIRAPAQRLFEMWTTPAHLMAWWGPRSVVCTEAMVDLRAGGGYRIANQYPDGSIVWIVGEFESVTPPHQLVYTWRIEPGVETTERVSVRFVPRDDATEVIVVHERIVSDAARAGHERGWIECLEKLAEYEAGLLQDSRGVP